MSIRSADDETKKKLAADVMEKVQQHFTTPEPAPLFMPRQQYDVLSPYLTGFFLVNWESPFDEVSDLPPMVTITDWMPDGS